MVAHCPVTAIRIFQQFDQFNTCFEPRVTFKQPSNVKPEKELSKGRTKHDTHSRAYNSTTARAAYELVS